MGIIGEKMIENSLVSIVVPVYNVEQYLRKCLNSIVNQTYQNIEIICVDDGSPDDSINILNEFAENDKRIKVIRQENQGLSGARNTGINNATGKYIMFVDSDDWIELNMVELMATKMEKENLDLVICGRYHQIKEEKQEVNLNEVKEILKNKILNGREYFKIVSSKTNLFTASAYNKLYITSVIKEKKLFFPLGKLYEDLLFVFQYLYESNRVGIVEQSLYNYVVSRDGAITNKINKNDIKDTLFTLNEIKKFLKMKKDYELLSSLEFSEYMFIWISRAVLFKLPFNEKKYGRKEINKIIDELKKDEEYKEICKIILKKSRSKSKKIFIQVLYFNNELLKILIKLNYYKNNLKKKIKI